MTLATPKTDAYPDITALLKEVEVSFPIRKPPELAGARTLKGDDALLVQADSERVSFPYLTPEERDMITHFMGLNPNAGYYLQDGDSLPTFQPRYPFQQNGQPDWEKVSRRRVYCTLTSPCEKDGCNGQAAYWIDRGYLTVGKHCDTCYDDKHLGSWAEMQWSRLPHGVTLSDNQTFITGDPRLRDMPLWQAGQLCHLGSGMRTGKTTHIFNTFARLQMLHPQARHVYLAPRISLARSIRQEYKRARTKDFQGHPVPSYGLFCQGATRTQRVIGSDGVVATISSLAPVMKALADERISPEDIYVSIDEVDFAMSLMNATIMKTLKPDNKALLLDVIQTNGLVLAGQTETQFALEALAKEFGIDTTSITGHYQRGHIQATAHLYVYPSKKGMKAQALANVMSAIERELDNGKRVYVFCQGRRSARVVATAHEDSILYDAYTKGSPEVESLLKHQRANTRLTVFTCAVDVGISLKDPDGYTIVLMDENPRYLNGIASTAQQGVRHRDDADREFHILTFDNRLPAAPSFLNRIGTNDMESKLQTNEPAEPETVSHLAARQGLTELSDFQPEAFLRWHLEYAGFTVERLDAPTACDTQLTRIRAERTAQQETEKALVDARAMGILNSAPMGWHGMELLNSDELPIDIAASMPLATFADPLAPIDIQRLCAQHRLQPTPYEQLAHERAWEACTAVGYEPPTLAQLRALEKITTAEDIDAAPDELPANYFTERQIAAAVAFVEAGIPYDDYRKQSLGYLSVHHRDIVKGLHATDVGETTHRTDFRRIGAVLRALLTEIDWGDGMLDKQTLLDGLYRALQTDYGDITLFDLLKRGAVGIPNALKFRYVRRAVFLKGAGPQHETETEVETSERHLAAERILAWMLEFLPKHYPCRIARGGDCFQLLCHAHWETFQACIDCLLRYRYRAVETDALTATHADLMPTATAKADIYAEHRKEAIRLWKTGVSQKNISETLSMSPRFVRKAVQGIPKGLVQGSVAAEIYALLSDGTTRKKADIRKHVAATDSALTSGLKTLIARGDIIKEGYGTYKRK